MCQANTAVIDSRGLRPQVQEKQQEINGWALLSCKLFLALLINNFKIVLKDRIMLIKRVLLNSLRSLTHFKILLTSCCFVRFYFRYSFKDEPSRIYEVFCKIKTHKQTNKKFLQMLHWQTYFADSRQVRPHICSDARILCFLVRQTVITESWPDPCPGKLQTNQSVYYFIHFPHHILYQLTSGNVTPWA